MRCRACPCHQSTTARSTCATSSWLVERRPPVIGQSRDAKLAAATGRGRPLVVVIQTTAHSGRLSDLNKVVAQVSPAKIGIFTVPASVGFIVPPSNPKGTESEPCPLGALAPAARKDRASPRRRRRSKRRWRARAPPRSRQLPAHRSPCRRKAPCPALEYGRSRNPLLKQRFLASLSTSGPLRSPSLPCIRISRSRETAASARPPRPDAFQAANARPRAEGANARSADHEGKRARRARA